MKELIYCDDKYKMNWIEGNTEWGTVKAPDGINVVKSSVDTEDTITERYVFTNVADKDIFTSLKDISIYTPFNDDYTAGAEECITSRCHAHIWCGENISYVMCLRMGGEAPHLGLVLTEGSLGGYSVERDLEQSSNDRGDFILHPAPAALAPNESFAIEWTLFRHGGKDDFYSKLSLYNKRFINVTAENYVVFIGEDININICPAFEFSRVSIVKNGKEIDCRRDNEQITVSEKAECAGEYSYQINIDGTVTHCNVLVMSPPEKLAEKRCRFIAEKQQYNDPKSRLDGAYLVYDNEEKHVYYNSTPDYNGGRERVGMGVLMAKYLQQHNDKMLEGSLKRYIKYVENNLLCRETGAVFNDYNYDNSWNRLYNYPWVSLFYLELYKLFGDKSMVETAYKIMMSFYEQGGKRFYAIEIPVVKLTESLKKCNMMDESDHITALFQEHAEFIAQTGLAYPAHEVKYEQSIVAPGANILLQVYSITGERKYFDAADIQIKALEAFNGMQPDYHLYETSIRHWDGYWFGKRRMYGDTFPHYWSALTGNVYNNYTKLAGLEEYRKKAEKSYRSVLSLIHEDGSASCAYVYPVSVNGETAGYYDPYANDQDWSLYFMLRYMED